MTTTVTSSSERILIGTLLTLTFVSGLIDAASVLALGHVFTANMTGNVVFLGFAFAGVPDFSVMRSGLALAAALVGGVLAGSLDTRISWRNRPIWLAVSSLIETILIGGAALAAWMSSASFKNEIRICTMIVLTAIAMGLRNGTFRKLRVPDLTTTVLTLTIAGLAFESRLAGGSDSRWKLRVAAILAMFGGAFLGVLLIHYSLTLLFFVAALLTALTALLHLSREETAHEASLNHN